MLLDHQSGGAPYTVLFRLPLSLLRGLKVTLPTPNLKPNGIVHIVNKVLMRCGCNDYSIRNVGGNSERYPRFGIGGRFAFFFP